VEIYLCSCQYLLFVNINKLCGYRCCCCVLLQAVTSRVECVRKDSELSELRVQADEAAKLAETADAERNQIRACFDQEIHSVRKTYESKVLSVSHFDRPTIGTNVPSFGLTCRVTGVLTDFLCMQFVFLGGAFFSG